MENDDNKIMLIPYSMSINHHKIKISFQAIIIINSIVKNVENNEDRWVENLNKK